MITPPGICFAPKLLVLLGHKSHNAGKNSQKTARELKTSIAINRN